MSEKSREKYVIREKLSRKSHRIPSDFLKSSSEERRKNKSANLYETKAWTEKISDYLSVKMQVHQRLLEELDKKGLLRETEESVLKEAVESFVREVIENDDFPLNKEEATRLADEVTEETIGVGPLSPLMADPAVSDILVNNPKEVFVERFGHLEKTDVQFKDSEHLIRLIQRIVASVGRRIDESSPYVDARLPDGSRVNATIPPVTIDGPTLSIRRFGNNRLDANDLVRLNSASKEMIQFLSFAIEGKQNLVISGGTGAGKSTLLGALAKFIPSDNRVITIEDTVELILDQPHVIRCETRPMNTEGVGEISSRDLVRNSLRMRPDRIVVGEVRGPEAFDMLQAMNTGHEGSMTTLHANSPRDALARLESMVLMAGTDLPSRAIREQFVSAVDLLVHIERQDDGVRRITSIMEVVGMEGDMPQTQEIFRFKYHGKKEKHVQGHFLTTGIVPRFVEKLRNRGFVIPNELFLPRVSE